MASPDHAATVRAFLDNCVPGLTTPDVADAQAALDALIAALAQAEHERDALALANEAIAHSTTDDWRSRTMIQTTYTFRKKPIEIQAWHWRFSTEQAEEPVWIRDALHRWPQLGSIAFEPHHPDCPRIAIATLEGVMTANPGDWIIRGVKGELYPCKPDIFEMTYERADAPSDRDALIAALAQAEHGRDEARKHANKLGRELDEQGDELERAERQRDQAIEALRTIHTSPICFIDCTERVGAVLATLDPDAAT